MQVPRLEKIVVNMGLGAAVGEPEDHRLRRRGARARSPARSRSSRAPRSRSRPSSCARACRSASMVTLRRERMWEFLDRLITLALPRVRDFRGVSPQGLRRRGQLHARPQGADHLPGDRLRQDRRDQGHEHHVRHDRRDRRGGPRAPRPARHAVPELETDGACMLSWRS